MAPTQPKQVFIFDMTRHRSHLFFRFLSTHPKISPHWHPFLSAFLFGPETITQYTKKVDSIQAKRDVEWDGGALNPETYAHATRKFEIAAKEAISENRIFTSNEHCQMVLKQSLSLSLIRNQCPIPHHDNPTVIPDETFTSSKPIFIIRHPVFAVPSNYENFLRNSEIRPGDEDWKLITSLATQRLLFDFFLKRNDAEGKAPPFVVDGDDVIYRTHEIGKKVCEALGIEPQDIKDQWDAVPEEKRSKDPLVRHFMQVSDDSTGIIRSEPQRVEPEDLEKAFASWEADYGEKVAKQLRETVEGNMVHYEYMKGWKI